MGLRVKIQLFEEADSFVPWSKLFMWVMVMSNRDLLMVV